MGWPESKPRLIETKRGAVVALCFAVYIAGWSVWDVLRQPQRRQHWLLDFDSLAYWHISLPAWVVAGINLAFYAYLLWGGALLYRIAKGKERILIVCWIAAIFLQVVQVLVSASVATAIGPVKALLYVAAFVAAVDIFLKMPVGGYARVNDQTSSDT